MKAPKGFMKVKDVPKYLGTSRATVYRLIGDGKLIAWRPGYTAYVSKKSVDRFLGEK